MLLDSMAQWLIKLGPQVQTQDPEKDKEDFIAQVMQVVTNCVWEYKI